MAQTKAQRRAAGRKAAETRKKNALIAKEREEGVHEVEQPDEGRTSQQDALAAYGIDRDSIGDHWEKPSELDAPPPRDGYTQRWIRIRLGTGEDAKNSIKKFREGWLPRQLDTIPDGYVPPTIQHARLGGVIGVDDLILCEMPLKKARQRNAFYRDRVVRMIEGIENDLNKISQGGPRIDVDHKTRVTKRRLQVPDPGEE